MIYIYVVFFLIVLILDISDKLLEYIISTTKKDKTAHGFGLLGMREIAKRYGGSFEVVAANGRFELVVCLPL